MMAAAPERLLVLACGALAREVLAVARANRWEHVDVHCLPAKLHVTPDRIPAAVDEALAQRIGRYDRAFIAYADCGTAGALDNALGTHVMSARAGYCGPASSTNPPCVALWGTDQPKYTSTSTIC